MFSKKAANDKIQIKKTLKLIETDDVPKDTLKISPPYL